jgi:hypothetical protein
VGWQTSEVAQDEAADSARMVGIEHTAAHGARLARVARPAGSLHPLWLASDHGPRKCWAEQMGQFGRFLARRVGNAITVVTYATVGSIWEVLSQESRKRDYCRDLCGGRRGRAAHACRGYPQEKRTGCGLRTPPPAHLEAATPWRTCDVGC